MTPFEVTEVRLSDIDLEDAAYKITTNAAIDGLARSIRAIGLLTPPILEKGEAAFRPVSGFRRIAACRSLGRSIMPARILPPGTAPRDRAVIAVTENALHRELNLIEESRSYALLAAADPERLSETAVCCGLTGNPDMIEKKKKLCALPDAVQSGLLSGAVALPTALALAGMAPETAALFAGLFNQLKMSLNKQKDVLELTWEISRRDGTAPESVLREAPVRTILAEDTDRNRQTNALRQYLQQRRFPELTRARERFREQVKRLKLPPGARLAPPQDFEGKAFTLSLSFKTRQDLQRQAQAVQRLLDAPALNEMLE